MTVEGHLWGLGIDINEDTVITVMSSNPQSVSYYHSTAGIFPAQHILSVREIQPVELIPKKLKLHFQCVDVQADITEHAHDAVQFDQLRGTIVQKSCIIYFSKFCFLVETKDGKLCA